MAENTQDQTTYANKETGEVPVAPRNSGDIIRENPYGNAPPPTQQAQSQQTQQQPAPPPPTTPLSQSDYTKYQIGSLEKQKETGVMTPEGKVIPGTAETQNLVNLAEEQKRINHDAAVQQQFLLMGNPERLLQAQHDLQAAQQLPQDDPNKASRIQQAQQDVYTNEGARPALMRAMADANRRDEELRTQIRQAQAQKIDPEHWWHSKSTEGKVLAGIGIVLGGIGGGLQRTGRNPALEVMNNAINNDIAAQKANIENSWKAIDKQHNLNNDAFTRDLHRQTWENNYRTAALEQVKFQLDEAAAKSRSETVKNNAEAFKQVLSDQQAKIRNDQWKLGVQAQQAEIARRRALSGQADKDVQALMATGKYTFEEAADVVYNRPHMRELIGYGLAPANVTQNVVLRTQYQSELNKQKAQAKLLGIGEGDPRYDQILDVVRKDPKFAPIFKTVGPEQAPDLTLKQMGEAEKPKDIEARTVDVQLPNGQTERRLAASKEAADEYRAKMGAAQQWEANAAKLKALNEAAKKQGGLSVGQVAEWNAIRADMVAVYGVMKEGSKKLPNQQEADNIKENMIGNPPNADLFSTQFGTAVSPSDMAAKVDARINNLSNIGNEARKAANMGLTQNPTRGQVAAPGGTNKSQGNTGNDGRTYGTPVK